MTVRIRKATDDDARGVVAMLRETNLGCVVEYLGEGNVR
jgi:hypothetical protein